MKNIILLAIILVSFSSCYVSSAQSPVADAAVEAPQHIVCAPNVVVSEHCTVVATDLATAVFNPSSQILTIYESAVPAGEPEFTYHGTAKVFMLDAWTLTAETPRGNVSLCLPDGTLSVYLDGRCDDFARPGQSLTSR